MSLSTVRVAVAYHSGYGHTAKQAQAVAAGAKSVSETVVELHNLEQVNDELWADLDRADAIIFGAPTYIGGPSGVFKTFADASSAVWAESRWKDKIAAGFTNSGHMQGDKLNSLVYFSILAAQHGTHWVNLGLMGGWDTSTASAEDLNRLGSWLGAMAQGEQGSGARSCAATERSEDCRGARPPCGSGCPSVRAWPDGDDGGLRRIWQSLNPKEDRRGWRGCSYWRQAASRWRGP